MSGGGRGPVLVVDDDADIREILEIALGANGYSVVTAVSGADCLAKLRGPIRPRVILLDMMMPEVNGWQVCEALAADPALSRIPVVVLTGNVQIPSDTLGVEVFLHKPIDLARLLEAVAKYADD
jgi:CheY-like chemotaxis protein